MVAVNQEADVDQYMIKTPKTLDISKAVLVPNKNLMVSVFRDKPTGELYVGLQNSDNPENTMLITAQAAYHLIEVIDKVFEKGSTTELTGTQH